LARRATCPNPAITIRCKGDLHFAGCWTVAGEGSEASLHIGNKFIVVVDGAIKVQEIVSTSFIIAEGHLYRSMSGFVFDTNCLLCMGSLAFIMMGP
jgi:hypothetical protein